MITPTNANAYGPFGDPRQEAPRWRAVVNVLDEVCPSWRANSNGGQWLGDGAVQAIAALANRKQAEPGKADFYVVRSTTTDPRNDSLRYHKMTPTGTGNQFDNLEEAKTAALGWAVKYRRSYVVYGVTEQGTAGVVEKPVEWVPA